MEETSTSVKQGTSTSVNQPLSNWFLYHQKILDSSPCHDESLHPEENETEENWSGHLVAESRGRGWTLLQPSSITHQPQPQLCPPNLHYQSLANSDGIQPKSHGEFQPCTLQHVKGSPPKSPPTLGQEVPTTQGLWKKFLVAVQLVSSEKIPSGQDGCANFPAYKENTSTNPGYSNPPQKVYWMVIPLSIEGRMFPSTCSLPRISSVLLICAVAVRTTSWRKAIQIIACRIFSGIHFSPSHRKIDHFSCSCYGVLFELRGITKQIPKQHNQHQNHQLPHLTWDLDQLRRSR